MDRIHHPPAPSPKSNFTVKNDASKVDKYFMIHNSIILMAYLCVRIPLVHLVLQVSKYIMAFIYWMVAQNTMRMYKVELEIQLVQYVFCMESTLEIHFILFQKPNLLSNGRNVTIGTMLYNYHAINKLYCLTFSSTFASICNLFGKYVSEGLSKLQETFREQPRFSS